MAKLGDIVVSLGIDTKLFKKDIKNVEKTMKKLGDNMEKTGDNIAKAVKKPTQDLDKVAKSTEKSFTNMGKKIKSSAEDAGKGVKGLGDTAKSTEKTFEVMGKSIKLSTDNVAKSFKTLGDEAKNTLSKDIPNSIGGATSGLDNLKKHIEQAGQPLDKLGTLAKEAGTSFEQSADKMTKASGKIGDSTEKINVNLKKNGQAAKETAEDFEKASDKMKKSTEQVGQETDRLTEKLKNPKKPIQETEQASEKAKKTITSNFEAIEKALGKVETKMKEVGGSLSKNVTLPTVAIGTAATISAVTYRDMALDIQSQTGLTGKKLEELKTIAKNVYKTGMVGSMSEASSAVVLLNNVLGETETPLEEIAEKTVAMSQQFETETSQIAKAVKSMTDSFGISEGEALDIITKGFQDGMNYADDWIDTLWEYSTHAQDAGFKAEEFYNIMRDGKNGGAFNLDKIGDLIKEMNLQLHDLSDDGVMYLEQLGISTDEWNKAMNGSQDEVKDFVLKVVDGLGEVADENKRAQMGAELMGTQYEDLTGKVVAAMFKSTNAVTDFSDTSDNVVKNVKEKFGTRLQATFAKLGEALEPLGEALLDGFIYLIDKAEPKIKALADWIAGISDKGKGMIVFFGGLVAIAGPVMIVLGSVAKAGKLLVSGLGTLFKAGKKINDGLKAMKTPAQALVKIIPRIATGFSAVIAFLSSPLTLILAAITAITVGTVALVNHLSKASIESNVFGDEVSKGTQKAVGAYLDMDKDVSVALNNMAWGQKNVTKKMAEDLIGQYDAMGDAILTEMKADHEEQLLATKDLFTKSSALTEEEEKEALMRLQKSQMDEQLSVETSKQKIAEILNAAKEEKRAITELEAQEIAEIQEGMKIQAVQTMSESQAEQTAILEAMKAQESIINAEIAAETAAKAIEKRDAVVREAQDTYDKSIAEIIRMRDESGIITAEQADKMILEATRQRDETIAKAEETHQKVIDEAKLQAGEHANQVDWETGQIKSKWAVFKEDLVKSFSNMGDTISTKWNAMWTGVKNGAASAWNWIVGLFKGAYNTVTGIFDSMLTGAKGIIEDIKEAFKKMKIKIPEFKLPKISVKTTWGGPGDKIPYPSFSVNWNAKGGFTDGIAAVGMQGGAVAMAGEAGREAIIPLEHKKNMLPFSNAVGEYLASHMPEQNSSASGLNINVESLVVREEADIQRIARELYRLQQQNERRKGVMA